uniref:RGS domain-containing protein n=1 Tax=Strongyloides stercoralis TaxID=6248 RepID=A0A0K0ECA8_STRER
MNTKLYTTNQQLIIYYHGFTKISSNLNSLKFDEIVQKIKKETPDIVTLQFVDSRLTTQSPTKDEIINISCKNLSNHIFFKNLPEFFGITVIDSNDLLNIFCYIFSINTKIHDYTFHQQFNQIFQFNCLQNNQLLINKCQQFPISIEHILETKILYKNKNLPNTNDNKTSLLVNEKNNDQLLFFDENTIKCQKKNFFTPLFFDRMSIKRTSLVNGSLVSNNILQYNNKATTLSYENGKKIATDVTVPTLNFLKTLEDPSLRESFMQFLTDQYCQENLSFFLIVKQYKSMEKDCKRVNLGLQIVRRFIMNNSDEEINIDNTTRQIIINIASRNEYPKDLFDQAYVQIENMLKFDLMPRFLKILNQSNVQENNDKENSFKRKLSFNIIKNKLLKIKAKNTFLTPNVVSQSFKKTIEDNHKQSLIMGTFRRSFVKSRSSIGYIF